MRKRIVAEINLSALKRNYKKIAAKVKPAKVLSVLKANAYGLGVGDYAAALYEAGCRDFGVADPYEALELKRIFRGKPVVVQILSSILPDEIFEMVKAGIVLPVIDLKTAKLISAAAVKLGKTARVQFKIDSGMGRLGIPCANALEVIAAVEKLPRLDCEGILTHCPVADAPENNYTAVQIRRFSDLISEAQKLGYTFRKRHLAASAAINHFPAAAKAPFNYVRAGIDLHGGFDEEGLKKLPLEPTITLKARIAQIRELPAQTTIGYNRTYKLARRAKIATIAAGYADGVPLALTNCGRVIVKGKLCPIVGRISMDYTTVDVSSVKALKAGDEVLFFGKAGGVSLTPAEWAAKKGTHAWDILCSLGPRIEFRRR